MVQGSTFTYTDSNVVAGTAYQYRVRAENDYGYSPYSAMASISIPSSQVAPPSNLQSFAMGQTQVNLTWSAANTNATSFQIERKTGAVGNNSLLATVPSTAESYADLSATANNTYYYRIRSQGSSGMSGYSNEVSVTTPASALPPAPNLTAVSLSSTQIRLSWISTATGVARFHIERRGSTGQYAEISQPGPSASYDDLGLTASTAYSYRMRVETSAAFSQYSSEITATTPAVALPPAPNLTASALSSSQIRLSWTSTATPTGVVRFRLERRTAATQYGEISQPALSTASYDDLGLSAATAYFYRMRVETNSGMSPYSSAVL